MLEHKNILNVCIVVAFAGLIHSVRGKYYQSYLDYEKPMYCFQCNSGLDLDCANIQPNDTSSYHYKPCLDTEKYNGSQPFCRKIVQTIMARDNMERVIRKCGWVRHPHLDCYTVSNDDHIETICQCFEAGCNSGPSLYKHKPQVLLLLFFIMLVVL